MKQITYNHLKELGAFEQDLNPLIKELNRTIPGAVDPEMKSILSVSAIILFASQFRRYIQIPYDSKLIPINSICFILAPSGSSKDRSIQKIRSTFNKGYDLIDKVRIKSAIDKAIMMATRNGSDDPESPKEYLEYHKNPPSLFTAMTNHAAWLSHLAKIEEGSIGAGYVYSGEIGAEMEANSGDFTTFVKLLSETYDMGGKEAQPLKDTSKQTAALHNLPISALLVGSEQNILFDEKIKTSFKKEFETKLARRSFFGYCPNEVPTIKFDTIDQLTDYNTTNDLAAAEATEHLSEVFEQVAIHSLNNPTPLRLEADGKKLYDVYLVYNAEVAKDLEDTFPISKLARKHSQWKALKLAGAFAIMSQSASITVSHLIQAIQFTERIAQHIAKFEVELAKEPYELLSDYLIKNSVQGYAKMTLHKLKKQGYITQNNSPQAALDTLVKLCNSCDAEGVYSLHGTELVYEKIIHTESLSASYKLSDSHLIDEARLRGATADDIAKIKARLAEKNVTGYTWIEDITFTELKKFLYNPCAYTPFRFTDDKRSKDGIISGTSWLCIDTDKSELSVHEMHDLLSDINHHIALTSNKENEYKFRIFFELDILVLLTASEWQFFLRAICELLLIPYDSVPQSAIYLGYPDREVYSVTDQNPLAVTEYVIQAKEASNTPAFKEIVKLTKKQLVTVYNDRFNYFNWAYNAKDGVGSLRLYGAAKTAHQLGFSEAKIIELITEISSHWVKMFPLSRLNNLIDQIKHFK